MFLSIEDVTENQDKITAFMENEEQELNIANVINVIKHSEDMWNDEIGWLTVNIKYEILNDNEVREILCNAFAYVLLYSSIYCNYTLDKNFNDIEELDTVLSKLFDFDIIIMKMIHNGIVYDKYLDAETLNIDIKIVGE